MTARDVAVGVVDQEVIVRVALGVEVIVKVALEVEVIVRAGIVVVKIVEKARKVVLQATSIPPSAVALDVVVGLLPLSSRWSTKPRQS